MNKASIINPQETAPRTLIRVCAKNGVTSAIAQEFGVSLTVASYALTGQRNSKRDKRMREIAVSKYNAYPIYK